MERRYNKVETAIQLEQVVDVELTDEQILKAASEIWAENPTKCMGQIIAYVSDPMRDNIVDDGLGLH